MERIKPSWVGTHLCMKLNPVLYMFVFTERKPQLLDTCKICGGKRIWKLRTPT